MECGELTDLIDAHRRLAGPAVLATVVDVAGSSYRRPGARMLVPLADDQRRVGLVSGGCLERDLAARAALLTEDGPATVSYDTRGTEERPLGAFGSGCDGVVHVLLRRLAPHPHDPLMNTLAGVADSGAPATLRTAYRGEHVGAWATDDAGCGGLPDEAARLPPDDEPVSYRVDLTRTAGVRADAYSEVLVEAVVPPRRVTVLGCGDDVIPVARLGGVLGWDTLVVPRRPTPDPDAARFAPAAVRHAPAGGVADLLRDARRLGEASAVLLMSHDFAHDLAVLPALLASPVGYVGLLGPKRRAGRLMADLHAAGRLPDAASLARLHTPVGLDLGSRGPREVALAIAAELTAVFNDRPAGRLAERRGPIHEPARHAVLT